MVCDHVGFFCIHSIRKLHRTADSGCAVICHANGGYAMLVLSRKNHEAIVIGGSVGFERMIKVTVLGIKSGQVRLGFEADADVPVHRLEVWERICEETGLADLQY
jgi:carbon storage regulator